MKKILKKTEDIVKKEKLCYNGKNKVKGEKERGIF